MQRFGHEDINFRKKQQDQCADGRVLQVRQRKRSAACSRRARSHSEVKLNRLNYL